MRSKRLTARLTAGNGTPVAAHAMQASLPLPMPAARQVRKKVSLPWAFACVLFVAVAVAFVFRQAEVMAVQRTLAGMQNEIEHYRAMNAALEKQIAALQTDEYVEKAAREKLGLVMPGEIQYMVIGYNGATKPAP